MSGQPNLFDALRPAVLADTATLSERADEWMDSHPAVMALFERFALDMAAQGRRFGLKALAERVRWECAYEYGDDYKLNNNHVAYIGRRLIKLHPELDELIERRKAQE